MNSRIIICAIIASLVFSSSIMLTAGTSTHSTLLVARMDQEPTSSTTQIIDSQTLAKYPDLQKMINEVDKRYAELLKINAQLCSRIKDCALLERPPSVEPIYQVKITGDLARGLIEDQKINLQKDFTKSYVTHIRVGDAIYLVSISAT